jgi:hypothetical protein
MPPGLPQGAKLAHFDGFLYGLTSLMEVRSMKGKTLNHGKTKTSKSQAKEWESVEPEIFISRDRKIEAYLH